MARTTGGYAFCIASSVVVLMFIAAGVGAEPSPTHEGKAGALGFVLGCAFERVSFGDDDPMTPQEIGPAIGVQLRSPGAGPKLVLEAALQPNRLENPHFDEGFRAVYLEAGLERGTIRPSLGVATMF